MKKSLVLFLLLISLNGQAQNLIHSYSFKGYKISYPENCTVFFAETSNDGLSYSFLLRYYPSDYEYPQLMKVTISDNSLGKGLVSLLGIENELNSKEMSELMVEILIESYISNLSSSPRYYEVVRGNSNVLKDSYYFDYTARFYNDKYLYEEKPNRITYQTMKGRVYSRDLGSYVITFEMQVQEECDFSVLQKIANSLTKVSSSYGY